MCHSPANPPLSIVDYSWLLTSQTKPLFITALFPSHLSYLIRSCSCGMDAQSHIAPSTHEIPSQFKNVQHLPFSILADLYKDLRNSTFQSRSHQSFAPNKSNQTRRQLLTTFWFRVAHLCGHNKKPHDNIVPAYLLPPSDAFTLMSLIVPTLDSAHPYLGMKEHKLADCFIKALDLAQNGEHALWLKHHKEKEYRPQKWKHDPDIVDGNLPTVLKAILRDTCPQQSSLTIGLVWSTLNILSQLSRTKPRRITKISHPPDKSSTNPSKSVSLQSPSESPENARIDAIRRLVTAGTSNEVAEVSRIFLKELDLRLNEHSFLNWLHPCAKQHYVQIHDIHKLLKDCHDPTFAIGDTSVQVGQYASVMLSMRPSRRSLDAVCKNLLGKGSTDHSSNQTLNSYLYFILEPKLDGERMQLHKWRVQSNNGGLGGYDIRSFSRRGNDSSAMYAEPLTEVVLSAVKAEDVILDGEIMIWNDLLSSWVRFENVREISTAIAKKQVPDGSSYILKFMVFDVLYISQGKNSSDSRRSANMVVRLPLHQRRALLEKIIQTKEVSFCPGARARIEVVGMEKGQNETELIQTLQRYNILGYEGVIAKNPDMPYVLAERNINISIKLKPDYFDGGIQDLDVLILGARYSDSRGHRLQRAGKLSSFLVGVRSSDSHFPTEFDQEGKQDELMKKCKWVPVGRVGTGYSDNQLSDLRSRLEGHWKDFHHHDLPEHFECRQYSPGMLSGVVKWIHPWNSVVVTIRAYELNRRMKSLRFPRMERINWEKPYFDTPTFAELLDLDEHKLPAVVMPGEDDVDGDSGYAKKKRKASVLDRDEEEALQRVKEEGHVVTGGRSSRPIISSAAGADVSNLSQISSAFNGICFHVIGNDKHSKEELETKVYELGGIFVQNWTPRVNFVICTTTSLSKVHALKRQFSALRDGSGASSILKREWIDECHAQLKRITIRRSDVVFATKNLASEVYEVMDVFGDYWSLDASESSLSKCLEEYGRWKKENSEVYEEDIAADVKGIVEEVKELGNNIFSGIRVFAPSTTVEISGSTLLLSAFGARIVDIKDDRTSHILVHSSLQEDYNREKRKEIIITEQWVKKCIDAGKLLDVPILTFKQ